MALLLALAATLAAAADQPPRRPAGASAQAIATIRIVSGSTVRFEDLEKSAPARLRETRLRSADGVVQVAKVVEFQ
jgi:hypothetical protein